MATISNPEVDAATRIGMSEHIKRAIPSSDQYFFDFSTGIFDNQAPPTTTAIPTTAQCIDQFADLLQWTTNMNPTEKGIPTEYDRQFYYRVVQPLVAALRGRGEVSFEHNDNV